MAGQHKRNTTSMQESPRCGAKTRSGTPCKSPAVSGKKRCRMHGGAKGSGAPKGNSNAFKDGQFTEETLSLKRRISAQLKVARELRSKLDER